MGPRFVFKAPSGTSLDYTGVFARGGYPFDPISDTEVLPHLETTTFLKNLADRKTSSRSSGQRGETRIANRARTRGNTLRAGIPLHGLSAVPCVPSVGIRAQAML